MKLKFKEQQYQLEAVENTIRVFNGQPNHGMAEYVIDKGKAYIETPQKYYFTDPGLRNARVNFRQYEPTHLMENVIYNELRMRGYNVETDLATANLILKWRLVREKPTSILVQFLN